MLHLHGNISSGTAARSREREHYRGSAIGVKSLF
jgi:hypothetical protein